jgi:hypothetical protein
MHWHPSYGNSTRRKMPNPNDWTNSRVLAELEAAKRRLSYGVRGAAEQVALFAALAEGRGLL